jgi:hypothetical protein
VFQLDLFQQDAFQDGTEDVVLRIDTAFQPNAFQSDGFQENAAPVDIPVEEEEQVTGGWPIYYPRRKRRVLREPIERPDEEPEIVEPVNVLEAATEALKQRQELRQAEQRDQQITAQLRAIYAEQDALQSGVARAEEIAQDEDDLEAILLLVS